MKTGLLIIFSFYTATTSTSPSTLNSSTSLFPLSIPLPLLPYFELVSNASKRQPRHEQAAKMDKEPTKTDVEVDVEDKVEASSSAGTQLKKVKNLGLRVPPAVREHYMSGRSGRQIVPGVMTMMMMTMTMMTMMTMMTISIILSMMI